jgi:hypothetical protein
LRRLREVAYAGIRVFLHLYRKQDVDGRNKSGHDDVRAPAYPFGLARAGK